MKKAIDSSLTSAIALVGGRCTKQRQEIFALLSSLHEPVTIQMLAKQSLANEVSVYRAIRFFKQLKLVEEIVFPDGSKRYARGNHHHHHVICSSCGFTEHTPCEVSDAKSSPYEHPLFRSIDRHEVTYYGVCVQCR